MTHKLKHLNGIIGTIQHSTQYQQMISTKASFMFRFWAPFPINFHIASHVNYQLVKIMQICFLVVLIYWYVTIYHGFYLQKSNMNQAQVMSISFLILLIIQSAIEIMVYFTKQIWWKTIYTSSGIYCDPPPFYIHIAWFCWSFSSVYICTYYCLRDNMANNIPFQNFSACY